MQTTGTESNEDSTAEIIRQEMLRNGHDGAIPVNSFALIGLCIRWATTPEFGDPGLAA